MRLSKKNLFLTILLFLITIFSVSCKNNKQQNDPYPNFGGDFTLTDHNNKPFNLKDLRGKVVLLFFGYSTCPDACPAAMNKIYTAYNTLDKDVKDDLQIVFVSVDHERDTPELLKKYMSYFEMGAIGLTGTKEEIEKVAKKYGVFYRKNTNASTSMDYLIDHTTIIFMIGKNGKVQFLFKDKQDAKTLAKIIKTLT